MFKVECPGCKAPYQVDERRVPPAGLKMRCPKCGSSFQVEPPPADPRGTSPTSPVLGAALGVGELPSAPEAVPRPPLPKKKPPMRGTMIGVAPPKVTPRSEPDPFEPISDADLPAIPGRSPTETAPGGSIGDAAADPFDALDLPAPASLSTARTEMKASSFVTAKTSPLAAPPDASNSKATLPTASKATLPTASKTTAPASKVTARALPLRVPTRALGTPPSELDLPAPVAPPRVLTRALGTPAVNADSDLPAPRSPSSPQVKLGLPAATRPGAVAARGTTPGAGATDLPSRALGTSHPTQPNRPAIPRRPAAPPPSPSPSPLPLPQHSAFDEFDADLPASPDSPGLPARPEDPWLPQVTGGGGHPGAGLPAPLSPARTTRAGFRSESFDDLPAVGFGAELPSLADGADLPVGMRGFGELDLPVVGSELPSVGAIAPSLAAGLPSNAASLPSNAASLPSASPPNDAAAFEFPASSPPADPFGAVPPAEFSPSLPPFGEALDGFGERAPSSDPFGGRKAFDPGFPSEQPRPQDAVSGEAELGQALAEPASPAIVRGGGGGVGYGEVNLDSGSEGVVIEGDSPSSAPADGGAEFDGLPSESTGGAPAVSATRARAAVPGSAVAEIQQKRRRRRLRVAVAAVVTIALGGGALTLVPGLGPFGSYFIVDQLRHGEYERILAAASDATHRDMSHDVYPDAVRAAEDVEAAAAKAQRFKPLVAYRAFIGFSRLLRFGGDPAIYASAKVALEELAEEKGVQKLDLAVAARSAVDGDLAKSRQILARLAQTSPRDLDVAITRGEAELKAKSGAAAVAAWKTAVALEKSPRTTYGLARATLANGDVEGALKLARDTLAQSPKHVGARLILAATSWSRKRDEAEATKFIEDVLKDKDDAGPEERIEAETLFGEIHLDRGRVSQAEQAFGEAIKIAEAIKTSARGARAMVGLGETLFRAGRYSQAISRFKTAAQADPDNVAAQVGVAKSSLELERPEEARDMLTKLRKTYPKAMQVAYWYGRAEVSFGERKEAEAAYRDAIADGKGDPDSVQAYIALAQVLSKSGQLDAANAALSEAQKTLPASPALHKALGRVAMTQGRYADARAAFERALALDSDDVEAKFLVGTAMVRQHEFDKALEIYDEVGKIDRDFPGLALERGILFQQSGHEEEALREYEAALAKAPNDPDLMLRVGCGKADAGNGDEAEKLLRKVLEQRPNSAETQFCLGRSLMAKHDLNDAIKAFDHAIQVDPNRAEYYLYQGWASNEAGSIAKASLALKKALELDQSLADAYWQRGVLRIRETRAKDAVVDLLKALELRPSRFEAHADLALAYDDLGKEDLALAEWQKAIAANPKEPTWRFHYGKMLNLRLQNAEAAEQLKTAIDLATAQEGPFPWLSEAHRLAAMSLGPTAAAIPHWQAFLKTGALDSPFRAEAKQTLKRLGAPWEDP